MASLAQIGLFVLLGLLASPSRLDDRLLPALLVGGALLLVARPLSVALSLVWFRMPWRQQVFISWAGLRGAVPIVLATFPLTAQVPGATFIFDTVFVLVVVRSEEHTSELQSRQYLVCRLLLEKKKPLARG